MKYRIVLKTDNYPRYITIKKTDDKDFAYRQYALLKSMGKDVYVFEKHESK